MPDAPWHAEETEAVWPTTRAPLAAWVAPQVLYDKHVRPQEKVTDYRTAVSGIRPHDVWGPGQRS